MRHGILLSIALCSLANLAMAQVATLPPGALLIDARTMPVDVDKTSLRIDTLITAASPDAALTALAAIPDVLQREATAARVIERFTERGDAVPSVLLDAFEQLPVLVFRRHEETAADWFLPVFDVPAKARAQRRMQGQQAEVTRLLASIDGAHVQTSLRALTAADPQVAAWTIERLPLPMLQQLSGHAAKAAAPSLPSPALAALARRTQQAADVLLAVEKAAPLDVLPLFTDTIPALAADDAMAVLKQTLQHPQYASASAFALTRLATQDTRAQAWLEQALASPDSGASVAAALAQSDNALIRIDALLQRDPSPQSLTHLALALRLIGNAEANQRLRLLALDPRVPETVRQELQR